MTKYEITKGFYPQPSLQSDEYIRDINFHDSVITVEIATPLVEYEVDGVYTEKNRVRTLIYNAVGMNQVGEFIRHNDWSMKKSELDKAWIATDACAQVQPEGNPAQMELPFDPKP